MHWSTWWQILLAVHARSFVFAAPSICEDEACRCDSISRVICNCSKGFADVTLRSDGAYRVPSMTTAIVIDSCSSVNILPDTIRNLVQLRSIEIRNSGNVYVQERALAWSPYTTDSEMNPGIRITIHNTTVNEIASHAIQGRVDDILISESNFVEVKPFAFSSLTGVKNIELLDNNFDNIQIQAFKKFTSLNFILHGGMIRTLPSRFLSDVEVINLFKMDAVYVKYMHSLTFLVRSPKKVIIESNKIDILEGDAFHMTTNGPITFRNNSVGIMSKGALLGFSVDPKTTSVSGTQELWVDNNTVTSVKPLALAYDNRTLTLRLDGLNLNVSCSCELVEPWRELLIEQGGVVSCWYNLEGYYVSLPTYIDSRCGSFKQNFWIYVLIGIIAVVIVATIITVLIVKKENEKKKKIQIVMPDGKTYRETEFHIVVERAELLTTDL